MRASSIDQNIVYNFGMITLNDDATDALAVPDPWVDPANWLWEWSDLLQTNDLNDGSQYSRVRIDSSAKRKLPQLTRSVVAILENRSISGASLAYYIAAKVLVALCSR